jgi:hypothetical protein
MLRRVGVVHVKSVGLFIDYLPMPPIVMDIERRTTVTDWMEIISIDKNDLLNATSHLIRLIRQAKYNMAVLIRDWPASQSTPQCR